MYMYNSTHNTKSYIAPLFVANKNFLNFDLFQDPGEISVKYIKKHPEILKNIMFLRTKLRIFLFATTPWICANYGHHGL